MQNVNAVLHASGLTLALLSCAIANIRKNGSVALADVVSQADTLKKVNPTLAQRRDLNEKYLRDYLLKHSKQHRIDITKNGGSNLYAVTAQGMTYLNNAQIDNSYLPKNGNVPIEVKKAVNINDDLISTIVAKVIEQISPNIIKAVDVNKKEVQTSTFDYEVKALDRTFKLPSNFAKILVKILQEQGNLKTRQMVKQLKQQGVEIDPNPFVAKHVLNRFYLDNKDTFLRLEDGTYSFKF